MNKVLFGMVLLSMLLAGSAFAGVNASGALDLDTSISKVGEVLSHNLDPATCLGTPINVGDMTLIPVVFKRFRLRVGWRVESAGRNRKPR